MAARGARLSHVLVVMVGRLRAAPFDDDARDDSGTLGLDCGAHDSIAASSSGGGANGGASAAFDIEVGATVGAAAALAMTKARGDYGGGAYDAPGLPRHEVELFAARDSELALVPTALVAALARTHAAVALHVARCVAASTRAAADGGADFGVAPPRSDDFEVDGDGASSADDRGSDDDGQQRGSAHAIAVLPLTAGAPSRVAARLVPALAPFAARGERGVARLTEASASKRSANSARPPPPRRAPRRAGAATPSAGATVVEDAGDDRRARARRPAAAAAAAARPRPSGATRAAA